MNKKKKKKVILDTNFLLIPGQFKVDIFTQIERIMEDTFILCVVDKSITELNKLVVVGKEKDRFAAKLALVLIRQKNLKTLHSFGSKKSVDDIIVKKADKNTFVATQDKDLRKKVRDKGARIIGLRQKKYLVIT
ncbi:MAG TPA: nucleotide-binding protein [Candidatus Woesearchaeota archaeon]|nr:nucleotide-binding protein [Candidatus Woesearchaeota archaeon]